MNWFEQRSHLNHYILANQVETELHALCIQPASKTIRLAQFIQRSHEFTQFLENACHALSFAAVVDQDRFAVWDPPMRAQIRNLAEMIFVATSKIPSKVKDLHSLLDDVIAETTKFLAIPQTARSISDATRLRDKVASLRSGISSLPHTPGGGCC